MGPVRLSTSAFTCILQARTSLCNPLCDDPVSSQKNGPQGHYPGVVNQLCFFLFDQFISIQHLVIKFVLCT